MRQNFGDRPLSRLGAGAKLFLAEGFDQLGQLLDGFALHLERLFALHVAGDALRVLLWRFLHEVLRESVERYLDHAEDETIREKSEAVRSGPRSAPEAAAISSVVAGEPLASASPAASSSAPCQLPVWRKQLPHAPSGSASTPFEPAPWPLPPARDQTGSKSFPLQLRPSPSN